MSYCRFGGDSDVYLIQTTTGQPMGGRPRIIWMLWVDDDVEKDAEFHEKFSTIIKKLNELRKSGKKVPQRAFERLNRERAEAGSDIPQS